MRVPYDALAEIRRIRRKRDSNREADVKMEAKILLAIRQGMEWQHTYGRMIEYLTPLSSGGKDEPQNMRLSETLNQTDYLQDFNQQERLEVRMPAYWSGKNEDYMKIRSAGFALVEQGEHLAKFVEYEDQGEQDDKFNPGETTHRVQLIWELEDGVKQYQWCKVSLHPNSNFYEVLTGLLGDNPPDEIDFPEFLDPLIGKTVYINIEHYKGTDGRNKAKVESVRPAQYRGRKAPTVQEARQPVRFKTKREPASDFPELSLPKEKPAISDEDIPF